MRMRRGHEKRSVYIFSSSTSRAWYDGRAEAGNIATMLKLWL
jgi:hypothetical protein